MIKSRYLKLIIVLFFIFIIGKYYFKFSPFITFDSTWYHSYVSIISGSVSIKYWDVTRGFGFPILIFFAENVFGKSIFGINMLFFIFYILLLLLSYFIIKKIVPAELKPYKKTLIFIAYIILMVFNPLIFGYSHVMLTESVVPFFSLLAVYLSILISKANYKNFRFYLYIFFYAIVCIYTYFIKQPYFVITLSPIIFTFIAELIRNFSWKKSFVFIVSFIFILISLFFSIKCWYGIIEDSSHKNSSDSVNTFVNSGIIGALQYHYQDSGICYDDENDSNIPLKFKTIIKKIYKNHSVEPCNYYTIYDVYDVFNTKKIDTVIFYASGNEYVLSDVLSFVLTNFIKHPVIVSDTYIAKYLTLIDFYKLDEINYVPIRHAGYNIAENKTIGMAIYNDWKNYWWHDCTEEDIKNLSIQNSAASDVLNMKAYESGNTSTNVPWLIKYSISSYQRIFIYGFLIVPILFIAFFILLIIGRKRYAINKTNKIEILFVIFGTIFMHLLAHTMVGAIIDRYAYVAYPLLIVGIIIIFIPTIEKSKSAKFMTGNRNLKELRVFILDECVNLSKIMNLRDDVLIISNQKVKKINDNIKILCYPDGATFNDKIILIMTYVKNNNYNLIDLHIGNCDIDCYDLSNNDINIIQYHNSRKVRNLLYLIYIWLFTGELINCSEKCTLVMNDKALFCLMDNNYFHNMAVLVKKILAYDLKYKKIFK